MLCISSCIVTVFHTHAPPKSHTLPHFNIGARKSITLIPVSKISGFVDKSSNLGDFLCIGALCLVFNSPVSSIVSHNTLNMCQRTSSHTGTFITSPVAITSSHFLSQSVLSIAIHLTFQEPSCCKTSITTLSPLEFLLLTSIASYIAGTFSNSISITTQCIVVILPLFI